MLKSLLNLFPQHINKSQGWKRQCMSARQAKVPTSYMKITCLIKRCHDQQDKKRTRGACPFLLAICHLFDFNRALALLAFDNLFSRLDRLTFLAGADDQLHELGVIDI